MLSRLRAISVAAIAGSALVMTVSAIAPDAAHAGSLRSVKSMVFTGPDQVAACNAWGQAGYWDTYRCVAGTGPFAGETIGTGYVITG